MRISVSHLRGLFLIVNLALALGLVYKALAAYKVLDVVFASSAARETHPASVELSRFTYVPEDFGVKKNPASEVLRVATDLQPQKPVEPDPNAPPPESDAVSEAPIETEAELAEGPLGEEWEYVHYILRHGNPLKNQVTLRKKDAEKGTAARSRTINRLRGRTRTPTRRVVGGRSRSLKTNRAKSTDTLSFLISDREIKNEDEELHFWVHAADREKLVYWMPGRPGTQYALPYKHEGSYLAQGPMRKELRPTEDEDDDGDDDEEEKKSFYIINEDADPEAAREARYLEIFKGTVSEAKFRAARGRIGKPSSAPPSTSSGAMQLKRSPLRPSPPTKKDMEQLKSAIDKIPKAEQEKLRKELGEMLQGKPK